MVTWDRACPIPDAKRERGEEDGDAKAKNDFHLGVQKEHTTAVGNLLFRKQLSEVALKDVKAYAGELIGRAQQRVLEVLKSARVGWRSQQNVDTVFQTINSFLQQSIYKDKKLVADSVSSIKPKERELGTRTVEVPGE